jgi:hypothetical protein
MIQSQDRVLEREKDLQGKKKKIKMHAIYPTTSHASSRYQN